MVATFLDADNNKCENEFHIDVSTVLKILPLILCSGL